MHTIMRKLLGIKPTYEQSESQNTNPPSPQLLPNQLYYLQPRERTFFAMKQMALRIKDSFLITKYQRFWHYQARLKNLPLNIWSVSISIMLVFLIVGYCNYQTKQAQAIAMANMPLHHAHEQLQAIIDATPLTVPPYTTYTKRPRIMAKAYIAPTKEGNRIRPKRESRTRRATIPPQPTVTTATTIPRPLTPNSMTPHPLSNTAFEHAHAES